MVPGMVRHAAIALGTKAETLDRLRGRLAKSEILDLVYFTVSDWAATPDGVLDRIAAELPADRYVVRSSALGEDGASNSMAGVHTSILAVPSTDRASLRAAVERVIDSYSGDPRDQVLVQPMLEDAALTGVATTHCIEDGAPYYVISYDDTSGKTDTITGGTGAAKTVMIFRRQAHGHIDSERIARVLGMLEELEDCFGNVPLDVEFTLTHSGRLVLLQARRLTTVGSHNEPNEGGLLERLNRIADFCNDSSAPRDGLAGRRTLLGIMPDWNPAEMIGTSPPPLAISLYRELITSRVWRDARAAMGYRALPSVELMVVVAGRPFIDCRNSFNSFLPAALDDASGNELVDAWLDRLASHPEHHDKTEFEIAETCVHFTFEEEHRARYADVIRPQTHTTHRALLLDLTRRALDVGPGGTLAAALQRVESLSAFAALPAGERHEPVAGIARVLRALETCADLGTFSFAVLARHGFISESLLRSLVARGALAEERVLAFRRDVHTILTDLGRDLWAVCAGATTPDEFLGRYGHLRPSTYDITSPRYADRPDLFDTASTAPPGNAGPAFAITAGERRATELLLAEVGFDGVSADHLLSYCEQAIRGREWAKFVFSRTLSDALEEIAAIGERFDLSRHDLAWLTLDDLRTLMLRPSIHHRPSECLFERIQLRQAESAADRPLRLPYILRDRKDIFVVPQHRSAPNFVGAGRTEGSTIVLTAHSPTRSPIFGKVVCIENADPGFDWIFTRGIRGLVTKFGGPNSHMAIRCAEMGITAAIGCGDLLFEQVARGGWAEIDSGSRTIRVLPGR